MRICLHIIIMIINLLKFIVFFSFIRLSDYLIVNTMHVLAVNSVATLLNYLEEQLQHTPPLSDVLGSQQEGEVKDSVSSIEEKVT